MNICESDRGRVLHLKGELDFHQAPALRSVLGKSAARRPALILELGELSHIDSTGIAVLLEYLRDATESGSTFCIANPSEHVRRVFEIVQIHQAICIFDDVEQAKSALRRGFAHARPEQPLFGARPERDQLPVPAFVSAQIGDDTF
jgi:anti-anti-sigma factor